jgi:putative membrane protein
MKLSKVILGTMVMLFGLFSQLAFSMPKSHDGEIIAYMQAINNSEINVSKMAQDKKLDEDVMKFAQMMVEQHGDNLKTVTDLSDKINIAPDETSSVKKFTEEQNKKLQKLSTLNDAKFQKAYIKAMIKGHANANNMIAHFEKEAQNADLKQYLMDTKKAVEAHLAEAKKLK